MYYLHDDLPLGILSSQLFHNLDVSFDFTFQFGVLALPIDCLFSIFFRLRYFCQLFLQLHAVKAKRVNLFEADRTANLEQSATCSAHSTVPP